MTESTAALLIGAVLGDSSSRSRAWLRVISALSHEFEDASRSLASPLRLNVVFHLSGKVFRPEFDGVRTGSYRKARRMLVIQAAVPGAELEEADGILRELLVEAVVVGEAYARDRKIADGLPELRELVAAP